MQRAARKVDQENTRLRALLSLHGISHEEVDTYLRSFDEIRDRLDSSTVVANNLLPVQDGVLEVRVDEARIRARYSTHELERDSTTQRSEHTEHDSEPIPLLSKRIENYVGAHDGKGVDNGAFAHSVTDNAECRNTSTCFCAPTTRVRDQSPNSGLEISCETAATIIADMRGDGDKERVRASLGCRKGEECNVKNTIVLQIMDER